FPFPVKRELNLGDPASPSVWQPILADPRLRKRAMVVVVARAYIEPYASTQPAPDAAGWARALAERLQSTGVSVVHVAMTQKPAAPGAAPKRPPVDLIELYEPGDQSGNPFDPELEGVFLFHWPTVIVVGRDEIVRAVFDGQQAWDMPAVERAARTVR